MSSIDNTTVSVFLSYSRKDSAICEKLHSNLELQGLDVKIDVEDIPIGENIKDTIAQLIANSDCSIIVVSENSLQSAWVIWEIQQRQELANSKIIPVHLDKFYLDDEYIKNIHQELQDDINRLSDEISASFKQNTPAKHLTRKAESLLEFKSTLSSVIDFIRSNKAADLRAENYVDDFTKLYESITGNQQLKNQNISIKPIIKNSGLNNNSSTQVSIHPTQTIIYLNYLLRDAKELEDKYIDLSATTIKKIISEPSKNFQLHGSLIPNSFRVFDKNQADNPQTETTLDSISEALNLHQYFVLAGEPGSGKSTTLKKLLIDQAKKAMTDNQAQIPVLINLAQWSSDEKDFLTLLAKQFRLQGINSVHIDRVLLLLDGLNEIAAQFYSKAVQALDEWLKSNPKSSVIISCREKHYLNGKKLSIPSVHVLPFDTKRIQLFLNAYLGSESAEVLLSQLGSVIPSERSARDLIHLAHNPYLLLLICFVYDRNNKQLPCSRGDLFREFIKALYTREQDCGLTFGIHYEQLLTAFSEIAFAMQAKRKSTSVHSDWAKKCVINLDIEDLWTLGRDANLFELSQDNRILQFNHQLILEYFAAEGLLKRLNELKKYISAPQFVNNKRKGAAWDEVLFTLAGLSDTDDFWLKLAEIDPFVTVDCLDHTKKDFRPSDKLIYYLVNRFVSYFSSLSLDAKSAAIAKLEQLGEDIYLEYLLKSLQESSTVVAKRVGLKLLSQYKNPCALAHIIFALNDKNKWLRQDAEDLLSDANKTNVKLAYNDFLYPLFYQLNLNAFANIIIKLFCLNCLELNYLTSICEEIPSLTPFLSNSEVKEHLFNEATSSSNSYIKVQALIKYEHDISINKIYQMIYDDDNEVRLTALKILTRYKDDLTTLQLLNLINHEDEIVRAFSKKTLIQNNHLHYGKVGGLLNNLINVPFENIPIYWLDLLLLILRNGRKESKKLSFKILKMYKNNIPKESLISLLRHDNEYIRQFALETLSVEHKNNLENKGLVDYLDNEITDDNLIEKELIKRYGFN